MGKIRLQCSQIFWLKVNIIIKKAAGGNDRFKM